MDNDLKRDLNIDPLRINDEVVRQPGLFAYYVEQMVEADRKAKHMKLQLEVLEAAIDKQVRDRALAGREKITETIVEKRIRSSDAWIEKKRQLIDLQTQAEQIRGIVEAMRQKKDMLITFATNVRQEMASGLRFNNIETGEQQTGIPVVQQNKD